MDDRTGQDYWQKTEDDGDVVWLHNPTQNLRDTGYGPGTAAPVVLVVGNEIQIDLTDQNLWDRGDQAQIVRFNRGAARWLACRLLEACAVAEVAVPPV